MKTHVAASLPTISFLLWLCLPATTQGFYNPATGRWLTKDPAEEGGGQHLYRFVSNEPLGSFDFAGLVDFKFNVVVGNPVDPANPLGTWGQPFWLALGDYRILDEYAWSWVSVMSRDNSGGSCNTVDKPDPSGTIILRMKDDCPGVFNVKVTAGAILLGTGPMGQAKAYVQVGRRRLIDGIGTTKAGTVLKVSKPVSVYIGTDWTEVARYVPTIAFVKDNGIRSTGFAAGRLRIEYVQRKH